MLFLVWFYMYLLCVKVNSAFFVFTINLWHVSRGLGNLVQFLIVHYKYRAFMRLIAMLRWVNAN